MGGESTGGKESTSKGEELQYYPNCNQQRPLTKFRHFLTCSIYQKQKSSRRRKQVELKPTKEEHERHIRV